MLLVVLVLPAAAHPDGQAQSQLDYASFLMKEQDYFRAISAYKQIAYFSNDAETKNFCLLQIAKAYHKSNRFKASIRFVSRLLNQPLLPDGCFNRAQMYLGLNYYGLRVYPMARTHFQKAAADDTSGFASYYLALLELEKGDWKGASKSYQQVSLQFGQTQIGLLSGQLSEEVLRGEAIRSKNPYLAAGLSTILPGSGQFYCHHYYDAIQAFLYVSAFTFASYAAYTYDKDHGRNYLRTGIAVSIAGLFHVGNIIGAQRTASYYNLKQRQTFLDQVRKKVFSIEY
ncbi:MAG: hypothetical protein JSV10_07830 [Candidatus Zixiibacteriota bacterium]|nr:MAG: hypothetical protein JSV10_07830 [candidate division Zixibacteria bacterium]